MTRSERQSSKAGVLTPWLISHGSEGKTRGGPTTRLLQIERTVKAGGGDIVTSPRIGDALRAEVSPGLLHVFNSWGLGSALSTLSLARRCGVPIVFSPIMLNLADRAFYDSGIKSLLRNATSDEQIIDGARLIHELTPVWHPNSAIAPREGETGHFDMLRRQTALCDHIICLSLYEQSLLKSIGVPSTKMTVVRNGVDTETMASGDEQTFAQAFGLTDFILMVGRVEPRKNQALAAFALRDIDVPLVIIGHTGDPEYFEQVKRWAGPKFVHIDRIDDRSVLASAYKAARALILPSWSEGAPLVALEAAAAGTPLILSKMSSEQEYFGDWADYVHPSDLEGMKSAVEKHLLTPEPEVRRAARSEMACKTFSIEAHVESTLEVYADARKEKQKAKPGDTQPKIIIDATHIAHQIKNDMPLTGVPAVELELGKAIIAADSAVSLIAWSSLARQHFSVPTKLFGTAEMGAYASQPAAAPSGYDNVCRSVEARMSPATLKSMRIILERGPGPARRLQTLFKHAINILPETLHRSALGFIRLIKPSFSPIVLPEHHLLERARTGPHRARQTDAGCGQVRISVNMKPEPHQTFAERPKGARLIVLGHAWISNDRYLDDLAECVARDELKLWVHIPDILYATRPDTFDAQTSQDYTRRLLRILEIADTIITISAQSENEVKVFARSSGIERPVRRISLGAPRNDMLGRVSQKFREIPDPYIVYVSSMSERKQHRFLVDVWREARAESAEVASCKLVLVGRPLDRFEHFADTDYQAQLAESGITVLNNCDSGRLEQLYEHAVFTVYPSAAEGWGLPPIESLMRGKPCLVSDALPVAQEVDNDGLKGVPVQSRSAWIEAIRLWLEDQQALQIATDRAVQFKAPPWSAAAEKLLES